ncbi:unnamed protein product [Arabis nemorensis]|uniref:Uncharacterized protein n=1 Tax=Arabis nemorensis TaxID=586526 RepID=A0A565BUZ9_9BRAS|nr:unnamed protein product [Arabis nemorensis]
MAGERLLTLCQTGSVDEYCDEFICLEVWELSATASPTYPSGRQPKFTGPTQHRSYEIFASWTNNPVVGH